MQARDSEPMHPQRQICEQQRGRKERRRFDVDRVVIQATTDHHAIEVLDSSKYGRMIFADHATVRHSLQRVFTFVTTIAYSPRRSARKEESWQQAMSSICRRWA